MLSGLRPEKDIQITFSGPRPGEKLFEELNEEAEGLVATHHEKINVFEGEAKPWPEIERYLGRLRVCCRERNCEELISVLRQAVPEYRPSAGLVAGVADRTLARAGAADAA
jgi:O-antigen biosynthesis protein WbqV